MIIGELTILRGVEDEDIKLFNLWRNQPEFGRLVAGVTYFPETLENTMDKFNPKNHENMQFLTITTLEQQVIGFMNLYSIDTRNRNCHFGLGIGEVSERSKGYGTDARRAILRYLFEEWNFHRVFGAFASYNIASRRSHEKLGAKMIGEMKRSLYVNGEYYNYCYYQYEKELFIEMDKKRGKR